MNNRPKTYQIAASTDKGSTRIYNLRAEEVHAAMALNARLDAEDGGNRCQLIADRNRTEAGQHPWPLGEKRKRRLE